MTPSSLLLYLHGGVMADEPLDLDALFQQDIAKANPDIKPEVKPEATETPVADEPVVEETETTVEDETPVEDETIVESPKADEVDAEDPAAIRNYFKEQLGEESHAWLDTFKTDEALLKGIREQNKLVGTKNEDAEIGKWIKSLGMTAQELSALVANKGQQATTPTTTAAAEDWNPSWVHVNPKTGAWEATAAAPKDFDERMNRYRLRLNEAMADPAKLANFVKPYIDQDIESKTQAIRSEAAAQAATAKQHGDFQAWQESKKALFFTDGDAMTPLGEKVNEYLRSGTINPNLPWVAQAEAALKLAVADAAPKPSKKPIPAKAKHQIAPAGGSKITMTPDAFIAKYGDDLLQLDNYLTKGELPKS